MQVKRKQPKFFVQTAFVALILAVTACQQADLSNKTLYPTNPSGRDPYEKKETIWGDTSVRSGGVGGGLGNLLGSSKPPEGAVIGVNAYLWRASLDTVSFMPLASADPFGGTIITDWYSTPSAPEERFKLNIIIMDTQLRADGVRVSIFRQERDAVGGWADVPADRKAASDIENAILTRARALRVAQDGSR